MCGIDIVTPGLPFLTHISRWFNAALLTCIRTSPGPGFGLASSATFTLSNSPCSVITAAFICNYLQNTRQRLYTINQPITEAEIDAIPSLLSALDNLKVTD
jgi:hypothetical protein